MNENTLSEDRNSHVRYIRIPEGNHVKENIKPITIITTTNKGRIIDLQKYYFI